MKYVRGKKCQALILDMILYDPYYNQYDTIQHDCDITGLKVYGVVTQRDCLILI